MTQRHKIQLFEDKKVRTAWDDEREEWYFSIVDVCGVLTESKDPQAYWRKLKQRLKDEGNETVTNCHALKMLAPDGKMRLTDVADTEQLFRLIQSIPSKKAEPFKQWMASVAKQRLDQMADPPEFDTLKESDYPTQEDYYKAVSDLTKNRDVYKSLDVLKQHYYADPQDAFFIVRLNGLKGQIDDYIGDINIYSPKKKRYITTEYSFSNVESIPETRDWLQLPHE